MFHYFEIVTTERCSLQENVTTCTKFLPCETELEDFLEIKLEEMLVCAHQSVSMLMGKALLVSSFGFTDLRTVGGSWQSKFWDSKGSVVS